MQLLPQSKVKEEKKVYREDEFFMRLRIDKLKAEKKKEVTSVASNVDAEKKKIQAEFELFKKDTTSKKAQLLGEIKLLEKKRDDAMQPYYDLKFQVVELMESSKEMEKKNKTNARAIEIDREKIDTLKNNLEKKEKFLLLKEQEISLLEINLIDRASKIRTNELDLANRCNSFDEERIKKIDEITIREKELALRVSTIESELSNIEKQKEQLINDRKYLASQQIAVKLAFDEARKKGIL